MDTNRSDQEWAREAVRLLLERALLALALELVWMAREVRT